MEVVRRPSFIDDLTECYAYLAARSPSATDRLLDATEATVERLAAFTDWPVASGTRPRHPLIQASRVRPDPVLSTDGRPDRLLRLLHGARRIRPELSGQ
ncbi:MAG: type II toxin-antitoxin system RelE/ParE family toxin [Caulobacteraceae bacterium]|nr:type II toxin-antitoxin system RelE/ParE family toxin [Caulobacteraceae bacterium]